MLPREKNNGKANHARSRSDIRNQVRLPKQRKEPLENASHVRNAVARFNQVKGVTEVERRAAWKRIQSAAKRYGVELQKAC
jgi:cell division protein FtsX